MKRLILCATLASFMGATSASAFVPVQPVPAPSSSSSDSDAGTVFLLAAGLLVAFAIFTGRANAQASETAEE